jgi:predicted flap endonuclease-1-like 5' DNA nuclease
MWRRIKISMPIAIGLLVLLWLHSQRRRERPGVSGANLPGLESGHADEEGTESQAAEATPEVVTSAGLPPDLPTDDLKRVEGIGPKISVVLRQAGILTYAQLAATDADQLRAVLAEAGIRLADPGTWPDQARLAADGRWEALSEFQAQLRGGRRV